VPRGKHEAAWRASDDVVMGEKFEFRLFFDWGWSEKQCSFVDN
jgi:hypothetical protein